MQETIYYMTIITICIAFLLLWIALMSFEKPYNFKIKVNRHYPTKKVIIPFLGKKDWYMSIVLDSSAWYQWSGDEALDVNKACGIHIGHIKKYGSFRIGWLPDHHREGMFWIYIYYYDQQGKANFIPLDCIQAGSTYLAHFNMDGDHIIVRTREAEESGLTNTIRFELKTPYWARWFGFYHLPYHGGKSKAPHTYRLKVVY